MSVNFIVIVKNEDLYLTDLEWCLLIIALLSQHLKIKQIQG